MRTPTPFQAAPNTQRQAARQAHRRNLQTDVDPHLKIYDTATNTSGRKTPQEDAASQRGVDHLSGALRGLPKAPRRTSTQSRSAPGLETAATTTAPFRKTPYYTHHGAPRKTAPRKGVLVEDTSHALVEVVQKHPVCLHPIHRHESQKQTHKHRYASPIPKEQAPTESPRKRTLSFHANTNPHNTPENQDLQ